MNANLLLDPVFGVGLTGGEHTILSLPALLAELGRGDVDNLAGAQRHQVDAAHMFLCALAATVLDASGASHPTQAASFWLTGLRALTQREDDAAWTLLVEDPTQPAFMQPPLPDAKGIKAYKPKAATPDALDVLQTAKNHDLKSARQNRASAEAWTLALISMQTMSGFLGQGNYGICRMNGGFASRPCAASNTDLQTSVRWREDVTRMLGSMKELLRTPWPYRRDGCALLWLLPWDGVTGVGLDRLHPLFIEVCRLVRLASVNGQLVALGKASKAARVTVRKETGGNVGDPWVPLRRDKQVALTVSERGFHPELLRDLIITHANHIPAPMQALPSGSGPAWFYASALVRGQGTTDGYHEARIYIAPQAKRLLLQGGEARDRLARLSDWALTRARDVRTKALRPALFSLLEGGPEGWPDTARREAAQWVATWVARYEQQWAIGYFTWLWRAIDQPDEAARAEWLRALQRLAQRILDDALRAAPQRTGRRYRGRVQATGLFHGAFRKHFDKEISDVKG